MGRPPLDESREVRYEIRITRREREKIRRDAKKARLSMSDYGRLRLGLPLNKKEKKR